MTVLLWGIESEEPLAMVRDELERMGAPYHVLHQRRFADYGLSVELDGTRVSGNLEWGADRLALDEVRGVYLRVMDDALLPEVADRPATDPLRRRCRAFHDLLVRWTEIAPVRVLNRLSAMASNSSKPYQLQLIRAAGFAVPETLVTNDPEAVLAFRERHRRVIFKSVSGVRSIVRELDDAALRRLEAIRWCPVQFQECLTGRDLRVHVVGQRVLATEIDSNRIDYRYAHRERDGHAELRAVDLDDGLADRCVALAHGLGLPLAGIDLKLGDDGQAYCFEVNPSPGFNYFEHRAGQPIAAAIADHLATGSAGRG